MTSVFHPGELAAQARAGVRGEAERVGRIIRASVPPAAASFLAHQRMLVIGGADDRGLMWSSLLTGAPGFLRAGVVGGKDVVDIAAHPLVADPLAAAVSHRTRLGAIAIEPATRRRMRVNGVSEPTEGGLRITADQVYANCPRFIRRRGIESVHPDTPSPTTRVSSSLDSADHALIGRADTFFIATVSATGDCDASHRGGEPGFLRTTGAGTVSWPDYPGNAMMMTLGNLEQNSAAGLLFLDWSRGSTLQLTGTARVDWDGPNREIHFHPVRVLRTTGASPLTWSDREADGSG